MQKTNEINQNQDMKNKNGSKSSAITRTVAGGLIGAAVGYIATPENGKKLIKNLRRDKLKSAGAGLGQSVKDNSVKAVKSLKDSAGKIFNKKEDVEIEGYSNDTEEPSTNETSLSTGTENKPENKVQDHNVNSQSDFQGHREETRSSSEDSSKDKAQLESSEQPNNKDYESLQKEHEKLQDRLGNIEELLTKVLQEKGRSQTSDSKSQNQDEVPDEEVKETYLKLNGLR